MACRESVHTRRREGWWDAIPLGLWGLVGRGIDRGWRDARKDLLMW